MEEGMQDKPQNEEKPKKAFCSSGSFCYCKAIAAILIIVLVWWWTPSWANIAITVLAALILLGSKGCCCQMRKK